MTQPEPAGRRQRLLRRAAEVVALLVVAVVAIAVAIKATPMQTVNVAGQVVTVGTTAPSWSLSGPGEVNLFGQSLPTTLHFPGPLRPRLALSQISINSQLTNFVRGANAADAERTLGSRLADGWKHYFAWESRHRRARARWSCSARWRAGGGSRPAPPSSCSRPACW